MVVSTAVAGARADEPARWSEFSYGVSLVPPPDAVRAEGSTTRWIDPRGFLIGFEIVTSEAPVGLQQVAASALVQMGFAPGTPRLLGPDGEPGDQPPMPERLGDRPALKMYFEMDAKNDSQALVKLGIDQQIKSDWFYGQAIIMLEPHAAVVIKLYANLDAADAGREAFEAVLASLHIPLGDELNEMREARVEAGEAWLNNVTIGALRAVLPEERWYRIVHDGKDVGHLHLRSSSNPDDLRRFDYEPPGLFVLLERREHLDGWVLDTRTELYLHDEGRREMWSTKTTLRSDDADNPAGRGNSARPGLPTRAQSQAITWAETGVRGDQQVHGRDINAITVINEAPPHSEVVNQIESHERFVGKRVKSDVRGRVRTSEWVAPDRGYLSQIHVWALGSLLPAEPAVYCFSAYHPGSAKPGLRTVEVQPRADGKLVVLDRPNSRTSPTRHVYDSERKLIESVTPQGVAIRPTTPSELAEIWGIDLK